MLSEPISAELEYLLKRDILRLSLLQQIHMYLGDYDREEGAFEPSIPELSVVDLFARIEVFLDEYSDNSV